MKYRCGYLIWFMFCFSGVQAQSFQLASPRLLLKPSFHTFFTDSTCVNLFFDLPGASVYYTLDGSVPNLQSPISNHSLTVKTSAVITAVAMHPDFLASEPARLEVIQMPGNNIPAAVLLQTGPASPYHALHALSLTDGEKGDPANFGKHWLGFEGISCDAEYVYSKKVHPKTLLISTLTNTPSWIFPPRRIEILAWSRWKKEYRLITAKDFPDISANAPSSGQIIFLKNKRMKSKRWRVVVLPYGPIPAWHPGKGNPAWLFVDEMRLY